MILILLYIIFYVFIPGPSGIFLSELFIQFNVYFIIQKILLVKLIIF
jgi:hypothetical protein